MDNQRLRQLVAASSENQKEIAEKLSISQQRFNFYVTGKREPDNEMLLRIADHFGTTTDYLLGRDDAKKEPPAQGGELSKEETVLISLFRQVPSEQRTAMLQAIEMTLRSQGLL